MGDFLVALGLVFVIEGVMYAGVPALMRRMLSEALAQPDGVLRAIGLLGAVIGLSMIWLVRG